MVFFSDDAEVRLDGELVRLVFCVDGEPVCQVAMRAANADCMVSDYLRQLQDRDGRAANIVAFPLPRSHAADSA